MVIGKTEIAMHNAKNIAVIFFVIKSLLYKRCICHYYIVKGLYVSMKIHLNFC